MRHRHAVPLLLLLAACGEKDVKPFDFGAREPYVPRAETPVPGQGTGTTYFVSSSLGSDANDGRSEGAPLASVTAVNALALGPGDTVAFRCGDVWRDDPLVVTWSGTEAAYVTITSWPAGCEDRPALVGSQPITGWAVHQGSIWVADLAAGENAGRFPLGINQLFRGAVRERLGRWPNLDAPDGGYSTVDGQTGGRTLVDADLPAGDWTGAVAHVKGMRWYILNRLVMGSSAGQLEVGADLDCWGGSCEGWGYYLNHHLATLDQDGEWFWDEATSRVYLYSDVGAPADAEGSVIRASDSEAWGGVVLGTHLQAEIAYVALENLEVSRWAKHGITTPTNLERDENHHLLLRHNVIRDVDSVGVNLATWVWNAGDDSGWRGGREQEIAYNLIERANHFGLTGYCSSTQVVGNTIRDVGVLDSVGRTGIGCGEEDGGGFCTEPGDGLRITVDQARWNGHDNRIRENWIERTGYCGMDLFGGSTVVEFNVIRQACATKGDCGAIRTFGRDDLASSAVTHLLLADNVVVDVPGNTDGAHPDFRARFGFGLYVDNYSADVQVLGNTITGATAAGLLFQSSTGRAEDNVLFDNGTGTEWTGQVELHAGDTLLSSFSRNVLVTLVPTAPTLGLDVADRIAAGDDNAYLHPGRADHLQAESRYTLATWRTATGLDAASIEIVDPAVADTLLFLNDTFADATLPVPAGYRHLDGTPAEAELVLPAFRWVVLVPEAAFP